MQNEVKRKVELFVRMTNFAFSVISFILGIQLQAGILLTQHHFYMQMFLLLPTII